MPIPLPLIVQELLNKVEMDGRLLRGAKQLARDTNLWQRDARLREERADRENKRLPNEVDILKAVRSREVAAQRLESLRRDNERLRREGYM